MTQARTSTETLDGYDAFTDQQIADPQFFIRDCLGETLWSKQREIAASVRDNGRTAVRSCHGAGKTFTAARIALWFLYSFKGSIVLTTAPTFRQVKRILWKELAVAYRSARVTLGGVLNKVPALEIADDWFALGFSTDDPDAFQGHHAESVLVVLDEASGIDREIWTSAEGVLASEHCRLLSIGNPTDPTSAFCDEFKTPGSSTLSISAFETPNFTRFGITQADIEEGTWEAKITGPLPNPKLITPEWVVDKVRRWGVNHPLWTARVLGEFPESSVDALIPLAWIEAAQARELDPTEPVELACDVARGGDETVIGGRAGGYYRTVFVDHTEDTMRICGEMVRAISESGAKVGRIDSIGVGGPVLDRLAELGRPVVGVNVAKPALEPERFKNARAEMFWGLRERFDPREAAIDIDPEDDLLVAQLAAIKWKPDSQGRIQIQEKEIYVKENPTLGSPDRADTIAMAFYAAQDEPEAALW